MCGHFGLVTRNMTYAKEKLIKQGVYVDALRGNDSTGICMIKKDGSSLTVKRGMHAYDYLQLRPVDSLFNSYPQTNAFMCHNRAATRGLVNNNNAHPFIVGDIILAHNGSLTTFSNLPDSSKFTVDSEAIAYAVNKIGIYETLKLLQGSFALVWYNQKDRTLNFCRNKEREFHIAHTEDGDIIYCSEYEMIELVANRNNIKIKEYYELEEKQLVTIDLTSNNITEWTTEEVDFYVPPRTKYWQGGKKGRKKGGQIVPFDNKNKTRSLLSDYDLVKGDNLEFSAHSFVKWASSHVSPTIVRGKMEGFTTNSPWLPVAIYGVNEKDFEEGGIYTGDVISLSRASGGGMAAYEIVLSPETVVKRGSLYDEGDKEPEVVDTPDSICYLRGPNGILVTKKEWNRLTKHGCCNCSGNISEDDDEEVIWMDSGLPMCPVCVEEWAPVLSHLKDIH